MIPPEAMSCADWVFPSNFLNFVGNEHAKATRCFHVNCQSARNKTEELDLLFASLDFKFDFIMLSETWYDDYSVPWRLPNYRCFSRSRTASRGGGVSLLAREDICVACIEEFCSVTENYEVVSVLCARTVYSVFYRPPNGNVNDFFSFLQTFIQYISDNQYTAIWGGDFNINMLVDSPVERQFRTLLTTHGYCNHISAPTRMTVNTSTCIDLFITNLNLRNVKAGVFSHSISDHMPIFLSLNRKVKTLNACTHEFQLISQHRLEAFRNEMCCTDWNTVYNAQNADLAYESFLLIFTSCYHKCFPLRHGTKRPAKIRKPWVTKELLDKIKTKTRLYLKFIASRDPDDFSFFKSFRNKLNNELRKAKSSYHYQSFNCHTDSRLMWKKLNCMLNPNPSSVQPIKIVKNAVSVPEELLADVFNNHFTSVNSNAASDTACRHITASCSDSIFLQLTNATEVFQTFQEIKNSTTRDVNQLQIKPIKFVLDAIAPVLTHVYNLCLSTGVFPRKMQIGKVLALFKKGDRTDISNYRPISILPLFSKCLEKLIFRRLSNFLESKNVITHCQFAFRKGMSTQLALLEQKEFILKNFEENLLTLAVFIDFSKAFDCINHGLLLQKLTRYGIRGVAHDLIKSYLNHRSQYVEVNGVSSQLKPIKLGVPQGSILGPLLFNIYVNDIVNVDTDTKYVIYADDTTLLFTSNNAKDLVITANSVLAKMYKWSVENALTINTDKTKTVLFQAKNKNMSLPSDVLLNNSILEILTSAKTLGVIFDEDMSWNSHINYIAGKLSQIAGRVYALKFLPLKVKLLIYHSLFASHLNYCILVWGTTCSTNINRLFLLQKKIIRSICNEKFDSHTAPLFARLEVIKLPSLYDYQLSTIFIKERNSTQQKICRLANLRPNVPHYDTRSPELWHVPFSRTNYGKQMIHHTLPVLLNNSDSNEIDCNSCTTTQLLNFYLQC